MREFIEKNDLTTAYRDDSGEVMEALQPKNTFNPLIQRIYQCVQHRAIHPHDALPDPDPVIMRYLRPQVDLQNATAPIVDQIRSVFPLAQRETEAAPKGPQLWKAARPALDADHDLDGSAKRARGDDSGFSIVSTLS